MQMNKQQLIERMEKATGTNFITRSELTDFLNVKDPKSVDQFLHGLPSVCQRYFVPDVCEEIVSKMKWR